MSEKESTGLTGAEQLVAQGAMVLKAENDRMEAIAIARPRDEGAVKERALAIIEADPEAAESAYYSIPYKEHSHRDACTGKSDDDCPVKEWVEGIGIEGAREIARLWRNNSSRVYISDEDEEWVYLSGVFLDLETNTRVEVPFQVSKLMRYRSGDVVTLYPQRLAMAVQAGVSKAARNAIVQAIPRHLSRAVYERAKIVVARTGEANLPKLLEHFTKFEVSREDLERFFGKSLEDLKPEERSKLRGLYGAFRESLLDPKEFFGGAGGDAAGQRGSEPPGVTGSPSATAGEATVTRGTQAAPPDETPPEPNETGTVGSVAAGNGYAAGKPEPSPSKPETEPSQGDLEGLGI